MSMPPVQPSHEKFAQFIGEFIGHVGIMAGSLEKYVVGKVVDATMGGSLEASVNKIRENADQIAQILFVVGCCYNCYTSPSFFLGGFAVGTLASASAFPANFPSLQNGELLGRKSADGYAAQKTMFTLAAINYYLGRTMLDDMTFSILAGLLTGNSFFHKAMGPQAVMVIKTIGDQCAAITQFVLSRLPFTNSNPA